MEDYSFVSSLGTLIYHNCIDRERILGKSHSQSIFAAFSVHDI